MNTDIKVGDYVRSYSFEHRKDTYVEGFVKAIVPMEGCDRYEILVERVVWGGARDEFAYPPGHAVYPPVNGTRKSFGGVCEGVEIVPEPCPICGVAWADHSEPGRIEHRAKATE